MPNRRTPSFKHIFSIGLLAASIFVVRATAAAQTVDLLSGGANEWRAINPGWQFIGGEIAGASSILDGAITNPDASTFLVSKKVFGGDVVVSMDVTFDEGRYLGVYLDFGQDTQTGIWMATGHALADDAADNEVERAYIKTVEDSFWAVRATGELIVQSGERLHLRFTRKSDYYSIYCDDELIVTYRKAGGYPPGPLQIRLTNARMRIHRLTVESDWTRNE